jgi:type II secretory pathway pseudopilin PulG
LIDMPLQNTRAMIGARLSRESEAGFTLIELLVASAMAMVVIGAAAILMVSALHRGQNVTSRSDRIGQARNAIEKLTVDLREGRKVTAAGPTAMTLETYCDGAGGISEKCTLAYSCVVEVTGGTAYKCTRSVNGGPAVTVVSELSSSSIFCFVPSSVSGNESACGERKTGSEPTYVGVQVNLASPGGGGATLQDGAALHNFGL